MPSLLQAGSLDNFVTTSAELALVLRQNASREWEIVNVGEALPHEVQQRMEVMQMLMAYQGTDRYGKIQRRAAEKLGISLRSVQRLIKSWQEQGLAGLSRQTRSDQGVVRTSPEWQHFVIKIYQAGNRGSCQMSPAQVHLKVRVHA